LTNNQKITFDPLHDVLLFDTNTRPAELLINGTLSGVQFSVNGTSIVLANISLDDLGISSATASKNVQFVSPGVLLVGEGTTAHDGDLPNLITGGTGDDALVGLGGNDTLDGGQGGDLMVGGLGDDLYKVDNAADVVTEENNSITGAGIDRVEASVTYTLTNYVENLTLTGNLAINGTGNTLNNILIGNAADNILNGSIGLDTMTGGDGNDTYFVDNVGDRVFETNSDPAQIDTVNSAISYALGANIENLSLINSATIGVGNFLDNHVTGNGLGNVLNGGYGADTMTGGDGNDIYIVDDAGDVVYEASNSVAQIDLVASTVSYVLGDNLENLRLLGTADINATGNALNNTLFANAGNNVLDGQGGNDTVSYASASLYSLVPGSLTATTTVNSVSSAGVIVDLNITGYQDTQGSGFDKLVGIENLIGSAYSDELTGNAGNNILDGGASADVLTGGKGNDTYYVDGADVVVELNGSVEGIDTVISTVSYRLTANVEYLTLSGAALNAIGNNLDNRLVGTAGNNFLDGRAGADKMDGGGGNDTYVIDNLGDEITDASGTDLVMTYINHNLGATIENLRLMGTNALNGTGNALNNFVWANIGDNVVDGGSENAALGLKGDTLSYEFGATSGITLDLGLTGEQSTGGSGTDTVINFENLTGSNYNDLLSGNAGANILDGLGGVDTVSYASATASVTVDLSAQTAVSGGVVDTILNFENITGSSYDDIMVGDLRRNAFDGGNGSDTVSYQNVAAGAGGVVADLTIVGAQNTHAAGYDTFVRVGNTTRSSIENLTGSVNNDVLTGDAYNNALNGSSGDDSLYGGNGADVLTGGAGNDLINGGTGSDTAIFAGTDKIVVDLNLTDAQDTGQGLDKLIGIENLVSGDGDDLLTGNALNNNFVAGLGDDTLIGGAGDDVLAGGAGLDRLTGGTGADAFVFDTEPGAGNIDRIVDFVVADDTIRLGNTIFTELVKGTLAEAAFVANTSGLAMDGSDRIIYETDTGKLFYDADGNGAGDAVQFAVIGTGLQLTNADFFVI
jgi:serralysin